jgi:hypothetical protein
MGAAPSPNKSSIPRWRSSGVELRQAHVTSSAFHESRQNPVVARFAL